MRGDGVRSDWQEEAACRGLDVELFFSVEEQDVKRALEVCAGCPVRQPCREQAMIGRETFGVWGGLRENERRRVFRAQRRRRAPKAA
jgi:WhiB family transcriptional regulator, redox-sensing transcriptional regulator